MAHGMSQDFSWTRSAQQYVELYKSAKARAQATIAAGANGGK